MSYNRLITVAFACTLVFAACGGDPPPPPEPDADSLAAAQAEAQRMADSIAAAEAAAAEEARRAEEERRRAETAARNRIIADLEAMVFFDYDRSEITAEGERVLRTKVEVLRENPELQLRVAGHADERGSTEYNLALGQRRAESVRSFFTSFGLDGSRFGTVSFGEERPMDMGSNEEAWSRNRRAEFTITAGANAIRVQVRD